MASDLEHVKALLTANMMDSALAEVEQLEQSERDLRERVAELENAWKGLVGGSLEPLHHPAAHDTEHSCINMDCPGCDLGKAQSLLDHYDRRVHALHDQLKTALADAAGSEPGQPAEHVPAVIADLHDDNPTAHHCADCGCTVISGAGLRERVRDLEHWLAQYRKEPTPTDLVHGLHQALYGRPSPARPVPPQVVWQELLSEVEQRRSQISTLEAAVLDLGSKAGRLEREVLDRDSRVLSRDRRIIDTERRWAETRTHLRGLIYAAKPYVTGAADGSHAQDMAAESALAVAWRTARDHLAGLIMTGETGEAGDGDGAVVVDAGDLDRLKQERDLARSDRSEAEVTAADLHEALDRIAAAVGPFVGRHVTPSAGDRAVLVDAHAQAVAALTAAKGFTDGRVAVERDALALLAGTVDDWVPAAHRSVELATVLADVFTALQVADERDVEVVQTGGAL